jgi:hypothetical protein
MKNPYSTVGITTMIQDIEALLNSSSWNSVTESITGYVEAIRVLRAQFPRVTGVEKLIRRGKNVMSADVAGYAQELEAGMAILAKSFPHLTKRVKDGRDLDRYLISIDKSSPQDIQALNPSNTVSLIAQEKKYRPLESLDPVYIDTSIATLNYNSDIYMRNHVSIIMTAGAAASNANDNIAVAFNPNTDRLSVRVRLYAKEAVVGDLPVFGVPVFSSPKIKAVKLSAGGLLTPLGNVYHVEEWVVTIGEPDPAVQYVIWQVTSTNRVGILKWTGTITGVYQVYKPTARVIDFVGLGTYRVKDSQVLGLFHAYNRYKETLGGSELRLALREVINSNKSISEADKTQYLTAYDDLPNWHFYSPDAFFGDVTTPLNNIPLYIVQSMYYTWYQMFVDFVNGAGSDEELRAMLLGQ